VVARLLENHMRTVAAEIGLMVGTTLPPSIRGAVLDAIGPLGIDAVIGAGFQDTWGSTDLFVDYRRSSESRDVVCDVGPSLFAP
jgi:hypothetical protein